MALNWASCDRRGTIRASVTATAHAVIEERLEGPFQIENLSAGGVLLNGPPASWTSLGAGAQIRLLLVLPKQDVLSLEAKLVRVSNGQVALSFVSLAADAEDQIQEAVLQNLEEALGPAVLVIDHSRDARSLLAQQLARLGCRVRLAATPLDAVRLIEDANVRIDVVMVDLFLGSADGSALLQLAAAQRPGIRRVLMSGDVRPDQLRLALLQQKADAVLTKPWNNAALIDAVLPLSAAAQ